MPLTAAQSKQDAISALAAARLPWLEIESHQNGAYITTRVRVRVGDAARVLAVLDRLAYGAGGGVDRNGSACWVRVRRRAGMAGDYPL